MSEGGRVKAKVFIYDRLPVKSEARHMGDGGISNTVEVRDFSKNTSQDVLEMYFENSRRSGGGDVDEVQIVDGVAYITFKEAEVAQRVVSHSNHQVDGHSLTVALFHPSPPKQCYQNRVLIQGLNNAITEEMLTNFLRTVTEAKATEFLYGEEEGNIVVTLSDNIDFGQLKKLFQERRVEGAVLKVSRVTISNCIIVHNVQSSASHDAVLFYFENKKRSGGGDIERVEMKANEGYCLVYFEDHSVIDSVLSKSHNIDGTDVEVHIHHECLGQRSSRNKSDPYLRMPSPGNKDGVTALEEEKTDIQSKDETSSSVSSNPEKESDFVEVQEWQENDGKNCTLPLWIKYKRAPDMKITKCIKNVSCSWNFHVYWNFYTKTKQGQQMLHEILNKYNCSVTGVTEDEDLFIFEVTRKSFEQESDVVHYIHAVLDNVYKCAQQFLYSDVLLVDQRIQGDVFQLVRQRKELAGARIELMGQQDNDAMCVVCTEKDKTSVLHAVTEIIHNVREFFENHEETISVDHNWQKVMKHFGYIQKLGDKYPNVTITLDETKPAIMLKGARDQSKSAILLKGPRDQSKAAADHLMELLGIAQSEVKEDIFFLGCQFDIFTYPEMCDYIDNNIMELSIVWIPNQLTKKIHLFSKKLDKIKGIDKCIKGCVQERVYALPKDQSAHSHEVFISLEKLKKKHTGRIVINQSPTGLIVTTADEIFQSVDAAVLEIINKQTGSSVDLFPLLSSQLGAGPKTKAAPLSPLDQHKEPVCLQNSEMLTNKELMENIEKGCPEEIKKKHKVKVNTEYETCSVKGIFQYPQKLEGYLTNSNRGYMEESLSSATDEGEFVSLPQGQTVENISQVKYQIFRYFFNDMCVSLLQEDIELNFSVEERLLYVLGEDQEAVDKATDDIRRAFDEIQIFQESDLSIKKEQFEYAKQLLVEMNSSFPERNVYCYIHDDDPFTIHVTGRNWEEVKYAKHKIGLKLGTYVTTSRKQKSNSTLFDKNDNEQSASVPSEILHPGITTKSFKTTEGIKVFVYKGSILQAKVNVIVNAANEDLKHEVGIARLIADAAGREFIEECQTYIKNNGFLSVGAACVTSGGRLKYPFVIHTVGPKWDKYSKTSEGLQKCMEDLWKTVIGCFFKAETLQVQSIALPAISSGKYGVPMEICTFQYLNAVLKYSKSVKSIGSLKEIHFIDVNDAVLDLITLAFSASLEHDKTASQQFDIKLKKVLSTFEQSSVTNKLKLIPFWKKEGHLLEKVAPHYTMDKKKTKFNFSEILRVLIYIGDITESKCKAIVSCEDKTLKSQSGVAKAIRAKAGQKFDACLAIYRGQLRQVGDLIEADAGYLKCEKVICCVVPMWNSRISDEDYRKQLEHCLKNIMEKAKRFKSVSIPLIGTGLKDASIEVCGKALLDSLLQFSVAHTDKENIREVHVISLYPESIACVRSIFMDYFDEQMKLNAEREQPGYIRGASVAASERNNPPPPKPEPTEDIASFNLGSKQPPGVQKLDRGKDDTQDNCVICMHPFKNPVKLKKCSHVFCKDCIDTQLQHKPVCPICNTIYGVITGNQPAGKMTEYIMKRNYLAGYEECGIIEITYDIPDGIQSAEHPKPGKRYEGLTTTAYLPNNYKGQKVLQMLHLAFDRRLIFTIGQSKTSGKDCAVTWNGILHKTRTNGGHHRNGYPDPTYLDRVLEELAAKGVTEESVSKDQVAASVYERVV